MFTYNIPISHLARILVPGKTALCENCITGTVLMIQLKRFNVSGNLASGNLIMWRLGVIFFSYLLDPGKLDNCKWCT